MYYDSYNRKKRLQELKICFKCLKEYSTTHSCKKVCMECRGEHNRIVCQKLNNQKKTQQITTNDQKENRNYYDKYSKFIPMESNQFPQTKNNNNINLKPINEATTMIAKQQVGKPTLPIIKVNVQNSTTRRTFSEYAFLDSELELSYIETSLLKEYELTTIDKKSLIIEGFSGTKTVINNANIIEVIINDQYQIKLISSTTIIGKTTIAYFDDNENIKYANIHLKLLIGSSHVFNLLGLNNEIISHNLQKFNCNVGKLVISRTYSARELELETNKIDENKMLNNIKKLWELDTIGINTENYETQNKEIQQQFLNNVRCKNNRYFVKLLWNGKETNLTPNFAIAYYRLKSLLKNLDKKPELKQQ